MVYLNKKGMHFSTVLTLILLLVVAVILILLVKNWSEWAGGRTDKEICRLSVMALAKTKEITLGKPLLIREIKCKTERVVIDGKDTDEMNEQIANLLYDCWWQFGEGKFNIAPERWVNPFSKNHCFVCSIVEFSDDAKQIYKKETLVSWMKEHNIPSKKITYKEYFEDKEKEDFVIIDNVVDPTKKHTIIFISSEREYLEKLLMDLTGKKVIVDVFKTIKRAFVLAPYLYKEFIELFTGEEKYHGHEGLLMLPLQRENIREACDVLE